MSKLRRMYFSFFLVTPMLGCSPGILTSGEYADETEVILQHALTHWDFTKDANTGELKAKDNILYANPNNWDRVVVAVVKDQTNSPLRLDAIVYGTSDSKHLKNATPSDGVPLRIVKKELQDKITDFRVVNQFNLVMWRRYIQENKILDRLPASDSDQGSVQPNDVVPNQPIKDLSPDSNNYAIDWTFGYLHADMKTNDVTFVRPSQTVQMEAIHRLMGTDVCPDTSMSAEDLNRYVFHYVRGGREEQPFKKKWKDGEEKDHVNLGYYFYRVVDNALKQDFSDQQRAAVLCTLTFFAIEELQQSHNQAEFLHPWDKEYTEALNQAESQFYSVETDTAEQRLTLKRTTTTSSDGNLDGEEGERQSLSGKNVGVEVIEAYSSPLVIGNNGLDIELLDQKQGVEFDLLAQGNTVRTGWVKQGAFLVLDLNQNGRVDDGSELFGEATKLFSGGRAANGFAALEQYDEKKHGGNANQQIDPADAIFARLQLWQDGNADGITQPGELVSLAKSKIRSISLSHRSSSFSAKQSAGNKVLLESQITLLDGKICPIYDVWFAYTQAQRLVSW